MKKKRNLFTVSFRPETGAKDIVAELIELFGPSEFGRPYKAYEVTLIALQNLRDNLFEKFFNED